MLNKKEEVSRGKFLSFALRHNPAEAGITLNEQGWTDVAKLLEVFGWKMEDLNQIVENNNKKRYEFNEEKTQIRACQGHSVEVSLELQTKEPPAVLFHGTATQNVQSILESGLKPMNRHAVHLSADKETATAVGSRHGKVVLLKVNALAMHQAGMVFELSTNGVWLTEFVAPEFIEVI